MYFIKQNRIKGADWLVIHAMAPLDHFSGITICAPLSGDCKLTKDCITRDTILAKEDSIEK